MSLFEIPLKPVQETFVDDPGSFDDVAIDELVFDLSHDIKDINKLHVYHAMSVLKHTLEDIILLQRQPERFNEFRRAQIKKYYGFDLQEVESRFEGKVDGDSPEGMDHVAMAPCISTPTERADSPPSSPPLKLARLSNNYDESPIREATPDSLFDRQEAKEDAVEFSIIPIEQLVKSANIDVVCDNGRTPQKDLEDELVYNGSSKIRQQQAYILKGFALAKRPSLSVEEFLKRLHTYSPSISVSVFIHSAYMMFKLCVLLNVVELDELKVHRFILASIRCSTKKLEDIHQKQKAFATVGGVSGKELFRMEVGFLYLNNFKMMVGEKMLEAFLKGSFLDLKRFVKDEI
ncbi:Cyclin [[Candida] zeylanoides]